jgi:hypothetical protein
MVDFVEHVPVPFRPTTGLARFEMSAYLRKTSPQDIR